MGDMSSFLVDWITRMDEETTRILQTENSMCEFFDYLLRERSNHTVCNKIMIRAYCPEAADVRPKEVWEQSGVTITKPDAAIWTLRYWGKYWGCQPQLEYDISATSAAGAAVPSEQIPSDHLVELLVADPFVKLVFFKGESTLKAYYNAEEKIITYTGGFKTYDEVCSRLIREYVHYLTHRDDYLWQNLEWKNTGMEGPQPPYQYPRGKYNAIANIALYLAEKRYGIKISDQRFQPNFSSLREARVVFQSAISAADRIHYHIMDIERRLNTPEDTEETEGGT